MKKELVDNSAISLFDSTPVMPVVMKDANDNDKIKCHWVKYEDSTMEEPLSLFDGFQELKVISFSYNFGFVARIVERFERAEIILGAQFLTDKMNREIANQIEDVMAVSDTIRLNMHRNKKLAKRIAEKEVEVRCPMFLIDHRKLYLLKADDGRVRVICPSANISARAWEGFNQIEEFIVSDDRALYEDFIEEFHTAWELSEPVVPNARVTEEVADKTLEELTDKDISGTETETYEVAKDNPIIENAKNSVIDKVIVVREVEDKAVKLEVVQYNKDLEKLKRFHSEILKEIKLTSKDNIVRLIPSIIKKYQFKADKISMKKISVEKQSEEYPRMVMDYANGLVFLNNKILDLAPSDDEVKSDIRELTAVFSNFDRFVGRVRQAKENHFKLMNALFSSPFNAKLRCAAYMRDIDTSGLPLYILLNSPANCGKTFMIHYFLKMMTGKKRLGYKFDKVKSNQLTAFQTSDTVMHKGIPIFIDEITSAFRIAFGGMIRTVDTCETEIREFQPLTVFASNVVSDPEESLRKRMVFLTFDIGLPSNVFPREFQANGKRLINRIGTAFYRKYLSYMLPYVAAELNKIETGDGLTDKYSPELMKKSSEIIIQILKEYDFDVPDYMKVLSWDIDYADNSQAVYREELEKINELYKSESKLFNIDEKYVTICLSNDKTGQKLVSNWVSLLPREIQAEKLPDANYAKVRMNRKELEEHMGLKFETGIRAKLKNWLS